MNISGKHINCKFLGFIEAIVCIKFYFVIVNSRMEILVPSLPCPIILYLLCIWRWRAGGKNDTSPKWNFKVGKVCIWWPFWFLKKIISPTLGLSKLFVPTEKKNLLLFEFWWKHVLAPSLHLQVGKSKLCSGFKSLSSCKGIMGTKFQAVLRFLERGLL